MSTDNIDFDPKKRLSWLAVRTVVTGTCAFLGPYTSTDKDQDLAFEKLKEHCQRPYIAPHAFDAAFPRFEPIVSPMGTVHARDKSSVFLVFWLHDFDNEEIVNKMKVLAEGECLRLYAVRTREPTRYPVFKRTNELMGALVRNHLDPAWRRSGVRRSTRAFLNVNDALAYAASRLRAWKSLWQGERQWVSLRGMTGIGEGRGLIGAVIRNQTESMKLVTLSFVDVTSEERNDHFELGQDDGSVGGASGYEADEGEEEEPIAVDEGN
ncbi:Nn.00g074560.m01.CDS01 [Neocucurbitaria sp. VM-36]